MTDEIPYNDKILNVAAAISCKDLTAAEFWALWTRALGGVDKTELHLTITDKAKQLDESLCQKTIGILRDTFRNVHVYWWNDPGLGYPGGPNKMFLFTMDRAVKTGFKGTLWTEMDCIPVKHNWFKSLENEYRISPQPFMGPLVDGNHMNGTGVYPNDWDEQCPRIRQTPDRIPWDCYAGKELIKKLYDPKLIQHSGQSRILFFASHGDFRHIKAKTVLFHSNKDTSLIRALNEHRFGGLLKLEKLKMQERYFLGKSGNHPNLRKITLPKRRVKMPGVNWILFKISESSELTQIMSIMHTSAIKEISERDYNKYIA